MWKYFKISQMLHKEITSEYNGEVQCLEPLTIYESILTRFLIILNAKKNLLKYIFVFLIDFKFRRKGINIS
jgi:hypothetical protein